MTSVGWSPPEADGGACTGAGDCRTGVAGAPAAVPPAGAELGAGLGAGAPAGAPGGLEAGAAAVPAGLGVGLEAGASAPGGMLEGGVWTWPGATPVAAGAVSGAVPGAGATGAGAPATGKSTRLLIDSPQFGQKRSSPLWIAAQRGHALIPASRRIVTGWRSSRAASSARSSVSMWLSVVSFAITRTSLRWPNRCRLKTSPPRSR